MLDRGSDNRSLHSLLDLVTLDFFLVTLVFSIASSGSFDGPDMCWSSIKSSMLDLLLVSAAADASIELQMQFNCLNHNSKCTEICTSSVVDGG